MLDVLAEEKIALATRLVTLLTRVNARLEHDFGRIVTLSGDPNAPLEHVEVRGGYVVNVLPNPIVPSPAPAPVPAVPSMTSNAALIAAYGAASDAVKLSLPSESAFHHPGGMAQKREYMTLLSIRTMSI